MQIHVYTFVPVHLNVMTQSKIGINQMEQNICLQPDDPRQVQDTEVLV